MNFNKEFYDDVKQRKDIAQSARHRVCGSRSTKCTLPSDNLTAAQKRDLNGPVNTYAISRPMTWGQFKAMPADLQQAHLDYIQNRFQTGLRTVSRIVFGISPTALPQYAKHHSLNYQTFRGPVENEGELKNWVRSAREPELYTTTKPETPTEGEPETPENAPEPETPKAPTLISMLCSGTVLKLSGTPEDLTRAITEALAGRSAELEVSICFR